MNDLEQRISERLHVGAERAHPPADLGARIRGAVVRRRRRRRQAAVTGTALAAAAVIAVPALIVTGDPAPPPVTTTASPSPVPTDTAALQDLHRLVDMSSAVTIPALLPDGRRFSAGTLYPDGTVLGAVPSPSADPDSVIGPIWWADPASPTPRHLRDVSEPAYFEIGTDFQVWLETRRDNDDLYNLICHNQREGTQPRRLNRRPLAYNPPWLHVDHNVIVWTEDKASVWMAEGCTSARRLPVTGHAVAFSYPDLYITSNVYIANDPEGVLRVDVGTLQVEAVPQAPTEGNVTEGYLDEYAANPETLVWLDFNELTIADPRTGEARKVSRVPREPGGYVELTAGNNLIAYTAWPEYRGPECRECPEYPDPSSTAARIYDPRNGWTVSYPGEVWAAGDWLLWSEGNNYRLARVR